MTQEVKLRRIQCNYQLENARFLLECDFSKQYSHYYRKRLDKTRPFLEFNCKSKWDPSIPIYGLAELADVSCDVDDLDTGFSPSILPDDQNEMYNSFIFSKRMRFTDSSNHQSPSPITSTQKADDNPQRASESQILSDKRRILIESPIFGRKHDQKQFTNCIVIGTIFKRMKLQPDVIEELSKGDFYIKCDRYHGHYTSQDDRLVLEDTDESISLIGNIDSDKFVTGVVVALLGIPINDGGQFLVRDICYAEPNRKILYNDFTLSQTQVEVNDIERPLKYYTEPIYLMVVSGLGFDQNMEKKSTLTRALQDLIDFIWGGPKYSDDKRSSRVTRILVAGDSLSEYRLKPAEDEESTSKSTQKKDLAIKVKQSRQVKQYKASIQAVKHLDDFLAQLSKTINVDIMPGLSDPSSHLMPQQPFHPCMFPESCMYSTFNCTSNPHHAIYNDNVEILATSGQNIDIISKFSEISDPIEIMKCHLMWGNSAPSAPDNLYSVPYEDDDPYIIDFIPEVYISGCQDSYQTEYYYYTAIETDSGHSRATTKTQLVDNALEGIKLESNTSSFSRYPDTNNLNSSSFAGSSEKMPNKGNHLSQTRKNRTLLVTVPKFSETFSCVLINLKNLESHLLSFR